MVSLSPPPSLSPFVSPEVLKTLEKDLELWIRLFPCPIYLPPTPGMQPKALERDAKHIVCVHLFNVFFPLSFSPLFLSPLPSLLFCYSLLSFHSNQQWNPISSLVEMP